MTNYIVVYNDDIAAHFEPSSNLNVPRLGQLE